MENKESILFIDDNEIDLFLAKSLLKSMRRKYDIKCIPTVSKSLFFLEDQLKYNRTIPSLIFLDLIMPKDNGFDFINKFNDIFSDVKTKPNIIIVTASIDPQKKIDVLKYNSVIGYIVKPLTTKHIKQYLNVNSFKN